MLTSLSRFAGLTSLRGYIAMLSINKVYCKRGIGTLSSPLLIKKTPTRRLYGRSSNTNAVL